MVSPSKEDAAVASYVSGGEVVSPPRWKTVFGALEEAAAQAPGTRIHLYDADGSYDSTTYGTLHEDALRLSRWLTEYIGVRAGENLILQVNSSHEYLRVFWAAVHAGVVVVPLSVPNVVDRENLESVSRVLATLGSGRVVVGSRLADAYLPAIADAGVDRDAVLVLPRDAELPDTAGASAVPAAEPDGAAVIFFTSGSTGAPKGAVQTHEAILAREAGVTQVDGSGTDVQLNWMPLEHAAGILMSHLRGVCRLSEQVQVAPGHILADPLVWLDLIDKYRVNYTWAPQFAYSLLGNLVGTREDASWDLSCLRQSINAGEMLNARAIAQLTSQLAGFGLRPDVFVPVWGMAETCSGVFYNRDFVAADEAPDTAEGLQGAEGAGRTPKFVALGRPIPGLEVLVADEGGEAVPEGQVGHLLVRGACVTREYFHHPTANEESFTPEGWFRTGDLAQVRDGVITMTGRAKQILIVNGLNFDLSEVEAAIEELPFVETSFTAAWAHTHPDSGEEQAVVFFVPRADGTDEPVTEVIRAHVLRRIGIRLHAVIPVSREDIPKTNLGKIAAGQARCGVPGRPVHRPHGRSGRRRAAPGTGSGRTAAAGRPRALPHGDREGAGPHPPRARHRDHRRDRTGRPRIGVDPQRRDRGRGERAARRGRFAGVDGRRSPAARHAGGGSRDRDAFRAPRLPGSRPRAGGPGREGARDRAPRGGIRRSSPRTGDLGVLLAGLHDRRTWLRATTRHLRRHRPASRNRRPGSSTRPAARGAVAAVDGLRTSPRPPPPSTSGRPAPQGTGFALAARSRAATVSGLRSFGGGVVHLRRALGPVRRLCRVSAGQRRRPRQPGRDHGPPLPACGDRHDRGRPARRGLRPRTALRPR
ncbi:2-succinylbenzoate--CoA ligase [Streptomyces microflavus]